jgi:hypothetical protein
VTKPTGNPPGRPKKDEKELIREYVGVKLKGGGIAMLDKVGRVTGERRSTLIRRYIVEGLNRDADKLT